MATKEQRRKAKKRELQRWLAGKETIAEMQERGKKGKEKRERSNSI